MSLRIQTVVMLALFCLSLHSKAAELALTIDDPTTAVGPLLSAPERDRKIRGILAKKKIKAALFVCGMRVDSDDGQELLKAWDFEGHLIGSHTYSHFPLSNADVTAQAFIGDIQKNERLLERLTHYTKRFRYPMLKEGESAKERDSVRQFLAKAGYRSGAVTIDASDWAIDARLRKRLSKDPKADLKPYRDFYLQHIWERATYYNGLTKKLLGREVRHTLLLHHNLLNALFLGDLIEMFRSRGWRVIDADVAFQDPVFEFQPNIIPAGEGLIWALAQESGKFSGKLRYPAEDERYEAPEMDRRGL